jgi:quinolinate synthase
MADMASLDQTLECWEQLREVCPDDRIVPITYMNSSAAIKAFVGEHGGAVCTSSNCRNVLEWALGGAAVGLNGTTATSDRAADAAGAGGSTSASSRHSAPAAAGRQPRTKILFFPDQHLGRNTAHAMGYALDRMVVWDPARDLGGNSEAAVREADFILWKGHCSVHQLFRPEHVDQARAKYPGIRVIVHPECAFDVVQKADVTGSTAYIVKTIEAAPPGSQWAIGTEVHLVNRLKNQHPDKRIMVLSDCQCLCTTMYRIDLPHLCWALENLAQGKVVNEIRVDAHTRRWATVALERMLAIRGPGSPAAPKARAGVAVVD